MNLSGLLMIVMKSLRQHALSTAVTILSVALACGMMMSVFAIKTQTREAFVIDDTGFDAVFGARASQLQLVLNCVYHLEKSPGNVPWSIYQLLKYETPGVDLAVPYAVGDNFRGYRIVGTTGELFERFKFRDGRKMEVESGGRIFESNVREAVVGSYVSQKTGLKRDSIFKPFHGLDYNPQEQHEQEFKVVGVLKPTNSPTDHVIWISIDSMFRMEGHVLRGGGGEFEAGNAPEIPDQFKEVSAVMLRYVPPDSDPMVGFNLSQKINYQGKKYTLAPVAEVMLNFFNKIGWMTLVLEMVAYLVVVVAAAGILASIYNTMNERRREFAILRALGARKATVFTIIILQSALIALVGSLAGFIFYAAIVLGAAHVIRDQVGVMIDILRMHPIFWITPLLMIVVGGLAGILPAMKAYQTDVATNLSPMS
ncbi:MAG: ABC transporter permease [Planctomycetota bacterium]|nr:ABC transporter permease [Planctomycetota bacterium]MDA1140178.1 ABC transporter permease [Planctomycetota bacterium]